MKRVDFIEKIKGNSISGSEYQFRINFKEKPNDQNIVFEINQFFQLNIETGGLSLFKFHPDWLFMEDNDSPDWQYCFEVDLNELYDMYFNNIKDDETIKIYRIETKEGKGIYDAGLGFSLLTPGKAPYEDKGISLIFRKENTDYMKKWKFAFKDQKQIETWLDLKDEVKIYEMVKKNLELIEIKIKKNNVVEGEDQVIFKPETIISKKKITLDFFNNKPKNNKSLTMRGKLK